MLREELSVALKEAMKARDELSVATVRLILAALKDRDIAARSKGNLEGVSDDEILVMLQSMIKQRHESIAMYEKGGRPELARREADEIEVIKRFLPAQLGEDETRAAVDAVIAEIDAHSLKDMGQIMGELKQRHAGRMDFAKANAMVRSALEKG
jgi:hypothetical protein